MKAIAVMYVFESESNPNKVYQTLHYTDGTTSCDCKGWTRRCVNGQRTCRHTRLIECDMVPSDCKRVVYDDPGIVNAPTITITPKPTKRQPTTQHPRRKFDFNV